MNFGLFANLRVSLQSVGLHSFYCFLFLFFFSDLNSARFSLEACKENASQRKFSETEKFGNKIVLEGSKEIQSIY